MILETKNWLVHSYLRHHILIRHQAVLSKVNRFNKILTTKLSVEEAFLIQGISAFLPVPFLLHSCLNGKQPQKLSPFISLCILSILGLFCKSYIQRVFFEVKYMNFSEEIAVFLEVPFTHNEQSLSSCDQKQSRFVCNCKS